MSTYEIKIPQSGHNNFLFKKFGQKFIDLQNSSQQSLWSKSFLAKESFELNF